MYNHLLAQKVRKGCIAALIVTSVIARPTCTFAQTVFSRSVSFASTTQSVGSILKSLESQLGLPVSYASDINAGKKIMLPRTALSVAEIVNALEEQGATRFHEAGGSLFFKSQELVMISGTVKGADDNVPLPGVTIVSAGKKSVGSTNAAGKFSVSVEKGSTVLFKYLGYATRSLTFNTSSTNIDILLSPNATSLQEVEVTTALGIKREKKSLGYATQTISSEQLNDARSNNWANALSGKVAGLSMVSPGSGPLNSVRISLRGDNSLDPNKNFALIVIDGVPVSSSLTSSGVDNAYGAGSGQDTPVDFGNGVSGLNPDDIESISVLKGASATALYGSRAANGALIITTKSGAHARGIGITFNSNAAFDGVLKWPEQQYAYGQGTQTSLTPASNLYYSYGVSEDGTSTGGTSSAFGPRFNGQSYYQYDPLTGEQSATRQLWRPYKDNVKSFFRTGSTFTNNISLEGGNDKGNARASLTHSKNNWIMPNTGYERFTASISGQYLISKNLTINSKVNFTNTHSNNLPATGYSNQSISYFMIFQNPNVDLNWYKPRWKPGMDQIEQIHPFSSYIDNPYLIAYEMTNGLDGYKTIGNMSANYKFSDKFNIMVRSGLDLNYEEREMKRPYSTANFQKGYYKQQNIFRYEINSDALLSYTDKYGSDFALTASVGGNLRSEKYDEASRSVTGLVTPGVYKLANGINTPVAETIYTRKKVNSLYGIASLAYKDRIFLDLTGRNDWSSTLPVNNNSFFYPSISSAFILNELFTMPKTISYAKLRVSAAQVGNDTEPYRTSKYYDISNFPSSAVSPTTLFNASFKPELTTSYEAGLEYALFAGRFGMDVTFYHNRTKNQIIPVQLDPTTGYSRAILNAGLVRNQGLEVVLKGQPINGKFRWNTSLNWSKNSNKVLELAKEMQENDSQTIGTGGNATILAKVGGSTGDIYGYGFMRSPEGQIVYTAAGLPARPAQIQYIGNAYADWKAGFYNQFSYGNVNFSFLIDGQYGGIVYSQTHHKMTEQGKLKHTLKGREEGFIIGEGVVRNADGSYTVNTTKVAPATYYGDYYRRANVESNSFDASFVKLREVRLEYNLSRDLVRKLSINGASIAIYGRNLAMITNFPMFDPETAALNGSTILPGIEMGQMPSTRTFGINLTVKF